MGTTALTGCHCLTVRTQQHFLSLLPDYPWTAVGRNASQVLHLDYLPGHPWTAVGRNASQVLHLDSLPGHPWTAVGQNAS